MALLWGHHLRAGDDVNTSEETAALQGEVEARLKQFKRRATIKRCS